LIRRAFEPEKSATFPESVPSRSAAAGAAASIGVWMRVRVAGRSVGFRTEFAPPQTGQYRNGIFWCWDGTRRRRAALLIVGEELMKNSHTLTHHRDIRKWVAERKGAPALRRVPDRLGEMRARLTLNFARRRGPPTSTPTQDDGISPCSWSAWLAELDRQQLVLRVTDQNAFEFIERKELN
jgi:hypothetical protein